MSNKTVEFNKKNYIWDNKSWYEEKTKLIPPLDIIVKLNNILEPLLKIEDNSVKDLQELLECSQNARDMYQFNRAQNLSKRVLEISYGHSGALAILCSTLRSQGKPDEAIKQTDTFKNSNYAPLLTSRAAALCDLNKWEEAKKEVGKALAIDNKNEESFSVVNRIKSARPDLYDEKKNIKQKNEVKKLIHEKKKKEKIKTSNKNALEKLKEKLKNRNNKKTNEISKFEFYFNLLHGENDEC